MQAKAAAATAACLFVVLLLSPSFVLTASSRIKSMRKGENSNQLSAQIQIENANANGEGQGEDARAFVEANAAVSSISFSSSLDQTSGYGQSTTVDLTASNQNDFGLITSWTCGSVTLSADINSAVAILTEFSWNGQQYTDATIAGYVSSTNEAKMKNHCSISGSSSSISFQIYYWDSNAGKFYVAASGSSVSFEVGSANGVTWGSTSSSVISPTSYKFTISAKPEGLNQIASASSSTATAKNQPWGGA